MQVKQAEIAFEIEKMQAEAQAKAQLMEREFQYNLQLHGMQEQQLQMREDKREGAKSSVSVNKILSRASLLTSGRITCRP